MKKSILLTGLLAAALVYNAQTIYSSSFGTMALQSYTTSGSTTLYSGVPAGFTLINDWYANNAGTASNPNKPFHVPSYTATGWAVVYNAAENDTFLVSTSWLDTTGITVNRWAITPSISGIGANSVLTWLAKSPDGNYREGYEVYGTTNLSASTPQDFSIGDRLFSLADGNTSGAGENSSWTRRSIGLGAFAGQTLRFAFRNNSKDMYQLWVDDIQVINLQNSLDAALTNSIEKKYVLANTSDSVKIQLTNMGATVINSVTLSYKVGNSSVNTENFSFATGLAYRQSSNIKFALPYAVSQPGCYALKSWVSLANGQNDQNLMNDTAACLVTIQNSSPAKTVLLEQFVSAHNGEGPDAQEKTQALQASDVIVVNIHDLDSIKAGGAAVLVADYKKNFATAMADRTYFSDADGVAAERPYYNNHINTRKNSVTPASVSIINKTFNSATNLLTFTVKADFTGEVRGDYRINAYLTENQVGGPVSDTTINGFNQWNNSYNIPWSLYYQKGYYSPVAGTYVLNLGQYRHQNVLVHAFNGAYGNNGIIPATGGTQGQSYQQSFSLTIPAQAGGINKFNPDNMYLVGFVAEYSADKINRRVLNAAKDKLTANAEVVGVEEAGLYPTVLWVYPNPSPGLFYFNSSFSGNYVISVYDTQGHCVRIVDVANSPTMQPLDLSMLEEGVYLLKIHAGRQDFTEKVIIQRNGN